MARSAEVWMDAMAAVGRPVTTAKVCVAAATTAKVYAHLGTATTFVERAEEHVAAAAASGGVAEGWATTMVAVAAVAEMCVATATRAVEE